tara:strand:+ start:425 stop:2686 length:2262 start_codon:yes stop_codon:yes gene_type:complete
MNENEVPLNDGFDDERSPWLTLAREAYDSSTSYLDANYRRQWERNLSLFQSNHPSGSKYSTSQYQHRSRLFRPKTRSTIRTNEAAVAAAFFSTEDVLSVYPENDSDPEQRASATILKHLLQYRLTKTIPWFQTLIAAYQEAMVFGSVIAHQYWEYKEKRSKSKEPILDDAGEPILNEDGSEAFTETDDVEILKDRPQIRLIASENLRIDPAADWNDPIGSSPFIVEVIPMYLQDVIERMADVDPKTGEPKWKRLSMPELLQSSRRSEFDSTRQTRQGKRQDPLSDRQETIKEYDTIFIHKNIIHRKGKDWLFYTAGTNHLLTTPIPLSEVYPHLRDGERPYVMGGSTIEAHKIYPSSIVEMTQDLQTAANDIANQRTDNVQLVLNKRYHIRRSSNIDINALKRSVPGGSVMMDDPMTDVNVVSTPDITASAYEEQDRLNVDFDDIAGTFSQGTVQSNRLMNETVGGMEMLSGQANTMIEYMIRTFAETWVEPVLSQLIRLEQYYETDEVIVAVATNKSEQENQEVSGFFQRFSQDIDSLLRHEMTVGVNVGIGATDPIRKIERLLLGIRTMAEVNPDIIQTLNQPEVTKEVFGALGYKDAKRFIAEEPQDRLSELKAQVEEMAAAIQQLTDKGAAKELEVQGRIMAAQIKGQSDIQAAREKAMGDIGSTQIASASRESIEEIKNNISMIETRLKAEKNDIARGELLLQKEALVHKMLLESDADIGISPGNDEGKQMSDVLMNDEYGMVQGAEG